MPDQGVNARWHGSGAAAAGGNVPDPLDWLGGRHCAEFPQDINWETILVGRINERSHTPVYSTRGADADDTTRKWWMVGLDHDNPGHVARIESWNNAAFEAKLENRPPGDWPFGATFRLYEPNQAFNAVSAAESFTGIVDYRCLYFNVFTTMTSSVTDLRFWVDPIQACGCELALVPATAVGELSAASKIADRFEDPLDAQGYSRFDSSMFLTSNRWRQPLINDSLDGVPHSALTMAPNTFLPIWFRRTVPAYRRAKVSAAFAVRWSSSLTGGDPDPMRGAMVIAFDIAGMDREVTVVQDREVHIEGGCRFQVQVDEANGLGPIPNEPVLFGITAGTATETGSLVGTNPTITDETGEASIVYLGSTDPTDEGKDNVVTASIGSGTEL